MVRYYYIIAFVILAFVAACKDKEEEPVEEKPLVTTVEVFCENTCIFANDSSCDDGGPGSLNKYCEFATDCADCGERTIITVED